MCSVNEKDCVVVDCTHRSRAAYRYVLPTAPIMMWREGKKSARDDDPQKTNRLI